MMKPHRAHLAAALILLSCASYGEVQILARLTPGALPGAVATSARLALRDVTPGAPFALFAAPSGVSLASAQAALKADGRVVWAEDNLPTAEPENQGGKGGSLAVIGNRSNLITRNSVILQQIHWSAAFATSPGAASKVAILDTGLSRKQPVLWRKVDAWADMTGGTADDKPFLKDTNHNGILDEAVGHGTMIAGICDMVAPRVHFVIAKVADSDGVATSWTLTKGLAFAYTHGAKVANVSLGSPGQLAAMRDVTDWCSEVGLAYVAAIGNSKASAALFPAAYSKVACVCAVDALSRKAVFSNWDGGCDFAAPGVGIVSQYWDGTMGSWSGSSFAAPFIAATAADYLRHVPSADSQTVLKLISNNASSIDALNPLYRGKVGKLIDYSRAIGPVAATAP